MKTPQAPSTAPPAPLQRRAQAERRALLLGLALLAAALTWGRLDSRRDVEALERGRLAVQARAVEQNLARQLGGVYAAMTATRADLAAWPDADRVSGLQSRLQALAVAIPGLQVLQWAEADGRVRASSRPAALGLDDSSQPYFATLRARPDPGVLYVSPPFLSGADASALNLSVVRLDAQGRFAGALTVKLDPDYFNTLLDSVMYASDMRSAVFHGKGSVVVMRPSGSHGAGLVLGRPGTLLSQHLASGLPASEQTGPVVSESDLRMVAMRTLRPATLPMDEALVVAVGRSLDAIYADWLRQTEWVAALFLAFALTAGGAGAVWQRQRRALAGMAAERQSLMAADAERLALALRGGDLALWDSHLPSGQATVNDRWYEMLGYEPGGVPHSQARWQGLVHPQDLGRVLALRQHHVLGHSPSYEAQYRLRHRDGHWLWVLARGRVVERNSQGLALRMVGTHMDITARVLAEEALRQSESQMRALLDALRSGVVVHGPDTQILEANPAACRILGLSLDQMRGKDAVDPAWMFVDEDLAPLPLALYPVMQVHASGKPLLNYSGGLRHPDRDALTWVSCDAFALHDDAGAVRQIVVTFTDITERKQAEEGLRRTQTRLRMASRLARLGDWRFDLPTRQLSFSPDACAILEIDSGISMLGRAGLDFLAPEQRRRWRARLLQAWADGQPFGGELDMLSRGGRALRVQVLGEAVRDSAGRTVALQGALQDVSEAHQAQQQLRLLERQLREAQKMESIGTLAGGIAHDFNNILAAILGNVSLARAELPAQHRALLSLEQIQVSSLRARSLVQQILTFSRRQLNPLRVQALRPIIDETMALLRATLPAAVRLDVALAAETLWVDADATQLQQVLMNLCTNAWHALPDGRGRIEVGCAALPADAALCQRAVALARGPCVHVWVRDDGVGMAPATLERIFDPFFTTKPVGQGTGLGLSVVHGIVRGHHGAVVVDSVLDAGSTFHLLLPLLPAPAAAEALLAGPEAEAETRTGQRVLYVDDDEVMLLMVERLLERAGFRVLVCADAVQALAGVRDGSLPCEIVVSDYNMPALSGIELARQLQAMRPGLPVVITSGFVTDALQAQATAVGVRALLKKERTLEELVGLLRQLLKGAPVAAPDAGQG